MTFVMLCHIFTASVAVLVILCFLDWTLGIDKLNPAIDKFANKYIDPEVLCPVVGCTFIAILSLSMYLVMDSKFFYYLYLFSSGSAIVIGLVILAFYLLYKLASIVRNYILSKKKP